MTLYSSRSYHGRKRLRPIQRTLKATATFLLLAFLPLTKNIALADVANRPTMVAAGEPRALAQERVVPPSGSKAETTTPQAQVKQGQKATFTSDSATDKHERKSQTVARPIVRQGASDKRNTDGVGGVESRSPVTKINPGRQNVKQGDAAPGTSHGPGRVESRGPVARINPGRYNVKQSDTPPGTSDGPGDVAPRGPIARINPEEKRAPQGEIVHFASASRHPDPKGRIIRQSWTTQWGQNALGKTLDVDTRQLHPGLYHLVLKVTDQRELSDTYTATLVVVNRPNPPRPPDISNPGPPRPDPPQPPVVRLEPPIPAQPPIAATTPNLPNFNSTNNAAPGAILGPSQTVVTISPNPLEVNRGAKAQFGSNTTATATPVVVERPPEVWLTTETQDPDVGQTVKFTGGTKPILGDTEYKFVFGDTKETNWSVTPEASHRYEEPRNYTVQIVARRAGMIMGQTSTAVTVKETPYSVTLTSDHENVRQGDAVTFTARVEPPLGDVEYQFRFSDAPAKEWTHAATTAHLFSRDGTYTATVAIRIRGTRIVESPAMHIRVSAPPPVWPWAVLAVALIAAATSYIKRKLLRVNFFVVPNTDLASLTIATSAKIDSDCSIGVRAARGDYKCMIQVDGALVRS
jgi:PKD domain-containing protein